MGQVDGREKFMAPLLSWQVGAGNQLMEYMSAAVMARALNRTLCLSPFFGGPPRHTGTNFQSLGIHSQTSHYEKQPMPFIKSCEFTSGHVDLTVSCTRCNTQTLMKMAMSCNGKVI